MDCLDVVLCQEIHAQLPPITTHTIWPHQHQPTEIHTTHTHTHTHTPSQVPLIIFSFSLLFLQQKLS